MCICVCSFDYIPAAVTYATNGEYAKGCAWIFLLLFKIITDMRMHIYVHGRHDNNVMNEEGNIWMWKGLTDCIYRSDLHGNACILTPGSQHHHLVIGIVCASALNDFQIHIYIYGYHLALFTFSSFLLYVSFSSRCFIFFFGTYNHVMVSHCTNLICI